MKIFMAQPKRFSSLLRMSMGRLFFSRIQRYPLVCRHYVSFSNLFKVSKESDPAQLLLLNCFILGDKPSTSFKPNETFPVEVQKTKNVGILKDLIKEKKSHRLKHVDASDLILSQVSLPWMMASEKISKALSSHR